VSDPNIPAVLIDFGSADDAAIPGLFKPIKAGEKKFTRRMAITMGDILDYGPLTLVLKLERMGLLRAGSFDWFKANGGITRAHIRQVRQEAAERLRASHKFHLTDRPNLQ
jgi:hypothetical protein